MMKVYLAYFTNAAQEDTLQLIFVDKELAEKYCQLAYVRRVAVGHFVWPAVDETYWLDERDISDCI